MANSNDKVWKIARLVIAVGTILVVIALAYGGRNEKLDTVCARVDKEEVKTEKNQTAIAELKTDIKYIKTAVDEIRDDIHER